MYRVADLVPITNDFLAIVARGVCVGDFSAFCFPGDESECRMCR